MWAPQTDYNPGYLYRCKITDGDGNVVYSEPGEIRDDPVAILTQPEDFRGAVGDTFSFSIEAYGTDLTYQWQVRTSGGGNWSSTGVDGYNTPTVNLAVTEYNPGFEYRCKVTDGDGNVALSEPGTICTYQRTWENTYNSDGLRTSRTDGGITYEYIYSGDKLSYMAADGEELYFAYDAAGIPMAVWYVDTNYYYVTNIQGDIIGILDNTGTQVVSYSYDAWGNVLSITGTMASTLGTLNPLRYRGYIYDNETELYYLQSRYYDPEIGRFINADAFAATGQGLIGNNMFAYCNNNPVNFHDPTGLCKNTFSIYFKVDCKSSKCKTSDYYQEPGFLKGFLQHMARTRNTGHTVSVGFTGGQNTGGTTGSKSHVLSVDSSYNYAFQETTSLGASVGAGGSVGLTISVTNASNISDLNGISYSHGITLIGCTGLSVDYVTFIPASNPNSHRWGVNVVVALGAEVEAHVSENYTTTTSNVFNPFLWLNKKIYGG